MPPTKRISHEPDAIDWDSLLQSTAAEALEALEAVTDRDCTRLSLGDLAQGVTVLRTNSVDKGVGVGVGIGVDKVVNGLSGSGGSLLRWDSVTNIPDQFRDVNLGDVLKAFDAEGGNLEGGENKRTRTRTRTRTATNVIMMTTWKNAAATTTNNNTQACVAELVDSWVRDHASVLPQGSQGPPVVVSGVPLGPGVPKAHFPELVEYEASMRGRKERKGGRQPTKGDLRSVNNRKSAAKTRKKRVEYTKELEERAKLLKDTNRQLRKKIVDVGKAVEAEKGSLEGKRLRKTRTLPTNFKV